MYRFLESRGVKLTARSVLVFLFTLLFFPGLIVQYSMYMMLVDGFHYGIVALVVAIMMLLIIESMYVLICFIVALMFTEPLEPPYGPS